ncbi:outer membrane cobalamin receptor protein [Hydrogenophaga taeniospiralis CCUG 15921]|uniref:Outer membrane cobalamin receptor protein n=1 Tax=Hydrogenophaga taeniospiralis CCUG 15921 TaxID=1281780 RepID=A0A9X4SFX7_9BURK|nr:TonB-dependent receptor [Hydrogenophaga taeniospiralis]MDG5976441.1 outer membrane cobalamin receptor protein [Hydrogenophaga taeniospiralis CCUG 15921]
MKNRFSRAPTAALPLAILVSSLSHAQTTPAPDLPEVVVTATRSDTRADILLSDVVVIEAEAIRQASGRSLSELLTRTAGLQMSSNGGLGKQSGLFVRGTETRHVLLLIDGVRYGSSTSGAASWDNIPLSAIERIEVLKGPASALYGSDAVGGVVQVFTRRGEPGFHPSASVTLGSYGHRGANAGLSGGSETFTYSLNAGTVRETGFSATNPDVSFGGHNPDNDRFDQDTGSASMRWKLAPGWTTDAQFTQASGSSGFDRGPGDFDVHSDAVTRVLGWGLERQWSPQARTQLRLSRSDDRSTSFEELSTSRFDTAQTQLTLQNDWKTPLGNAIVGFDAVKESVDSTQAYAVNSRTTRALFAGLQGEAGRHLWQANLRRDENSQFGGATTGVASYGFQLTPHWRPHLAYGTSFKTPSFNTLYWVSPFFVGNPSTQPERGKNREFGLTYNRDAHEVKLTRFDNRVRGFITTQPVVENVPQARIEGWSLVYAASAGAWSWSTQLELLDARNLANGRKLQRRADKTLTASLDHQLGAWTWGASLLAMSGRFDDAANTVALAGFATLDLHTQYRLDPNWSLNLRLNNLADKAYETARGYNQPGRAAYVTVDWRPQR